MPMHHSRRCTMAMAHTGLPYFYSGFCLLLVLALLTRVLLRAGRKKLAPRPPPGPWQLPVIGSLHHLLRRQVPHRTMRDLSARHGPVMLLRICGRAAVVVSSAEAAREVLGRGGHDVAFEQRPGIDELSRYGQGVVFAPYGGHWRLLRRILVTELLSARRVEAFRRVREDEAARLVSSVASVPPGAPVDMDALLEAFVAGSAMRAIFGDRLSEADTAAFLRMLKKGQDPSSLFDLRDLFPSSRLVRMLPRNRKAERHMEGVFRLMDDILRQHEERRAAGEGDDGEQDMIDVLLRVQKEGDMRVALTHGVIRAMVIDVFGAALDTSTTVVQWAMAELVANPKVMEKAQLEIRQAMAGRPRVDEDSLRHLHYLKAVLKEALRMHPPGPFFPRVCSDDREIQGYHVAKGTIAIINAWAIGRDPKYWEDPDKFAPERFEGGCSFDYKGFDFEFIPFGAGRRMCPGLTFAHANIELALASILYHFDWKMPCGVKPEELDMTEVAGFTVRRKDPLLLHPVQCIPICEREVLVSRADPGQNLSGPLYNLLQ